MQSNCLIMAFLLFSSVPGARRVICSTFSEETRKDSFGHVVACPTLFQLGLPRSACHFPCYSESLIYYTLLKSSGSSQFLITHTPFSLNFLYPQKPSLIFLQNLSPISIVNCTFLFVPYISFCLSSVARRDLFKLSSKENSRSFYVCGAK